MAEKRARHKRYSEDFKLQTAKLTVEGGYTYHQAAQQLGVSDWAYHPGTIELFLDRVRILCEHRVVAIHVRCYQAGQFVLDPLHYLKLLERKPHRLDNARVFKGQPCGEAFDLMRTELEYRYRQDGTRRYIKVLMLSTEYPEVEVKAAVERCVQRQVFSEDAVLNVLRNKPLPPRCRPDRSDRPDLITQGNGVRDTGIYDRLKAREEVLL
jgi:hypothetical protein